MRAYTRRVNYYETDKMGVVHHSNYIRYFEEARTSFMEQVGYDYPRLEAEGIVSPVTAVSCTYKTPLRYGDTATVQVYLTGMTRVRCAFSYRVLDGQGKLAATGNSQHCFLDGAGRPVNIQRENPEFYNTFSGELEPEPK